MAASVQDGDQVELILRPGAYPHDYFDKELAGKPFERTVKGTVRRFERVDRVLDNEGYAVDKIVTERWEVVTGDPAYPAIGFDPATAEFK